MNPTRRSFIGGVAALFVGFTALMVGPKQLEDSEPEPWVVDDDSWPTDGQPWDVMWRDGYPVVFGEPGRLAVLRRGESVLPPLAMRRIAIPLARWKRMRATVAFDEPI